MTKRYEGGGLANAERERQPLRGVARFGTALVTMIFAGCAHHPATVHCDGRLQPINLPAPIPPADTGSYVTPSSTAPPVSALAPATAGKLTGERRAAEGEIASAGESPKP
jgi:hypothetical protein